MFNAEIYREYLQYGNMTWIGHKKVMERAV